MQFYISIQFFITRCTLPSSVYNGTDTWNNHSIEHTALIERYIPKDSEGDYEKCKLYVYEEINGTETNETVSCESWVYDQSQVQSSIVTDVR